MPQRHPHGFSWIELAVVLSIVCVLASLVLPAFAESMAHHRLRAACEALLEALDQARARAVRRDHRTSVCASSNGHTCSVSPDWTQGWIGLDLQLRTVFEVMSSLDGKLGATHRIGRRVVDFDENGTTPDNQTITLCVRGRPATALSIVVAKSGLARRQTASSADATACARAPSQKR